VDKVFGLTDIGFCPDLGHLVAAGGDAVDLVTRYADRIPYIHYKDVTADGAFVPLGEGVIDFAGVTAALRDAGYDGWIVIELDGYDGDPDAAARNNLEYVQRLLAG
jgi:inosose dehydratase